MESTPVRSPTPGPGQGTSHTYSRGGTLGTLCFIQLQFRGCDLKTTLQADFWVGTLISPKRNDGLMLSTVTLGNLFHFLHLPSVCVLLLSVGMAVLISSTQDHQVLLETHICEKTDTFQFQSHRALTVSSDLYKCVLHSGFLKIKRYFCVLWKL